MPDYEGISVKLGGREFIVPPLNFKPLRRFLPIVQNLQNESDPIKLMDIYVDILHAAIRRNYPEMTRDDLEELLDFSNAPKVFQAIMGASGLKTGEKLAGNVLTGMESTVT
jgi:hypothetical protein